MPLEGVSRGQIDAASRALDGDGGPDSSSTTTATAVVLVAPGRTPINVAELLARGERARSGLSAATSLGGGTDPSPATPDVDATGANPASTPDPIDATNPTSAVLTGERRSVLSGIAKATLDRLSKMGGGLAYIAKHPEILPGIVAKGAVGWGENIAHPVAAPIQALRHKKALTRDGLYWTAGLIEGAVETFIIYNTLPPGWARLARAGISLAVSQAPMLVSYIRESKEKVEAHKNIADPAVLSAELTAIEQRHTRAAGFVKSFCRGRAAAGTYENVIKLLTPTGLVETGAELALKAAGVDDPEQLLIKGFHGAKKALYGVDSYSSDNLVVNADYVMSDLVFTQTRDAFFDNPKIIDSTKVINENILKDVLEVSSVAKKHLADKAFLEQVQAGIGFKTNEWITGRFAQGAKEALIADPTMGAVKAAEAGQKRVYDALDELFADKDAYSQFIDERKGIITQAIQEHDARAASAAAQSAAEQPTKQGVAAAISRAAQEHHNGNAAIPATTATQEVAAQQILQNDEVNKAIEVYINDFANTRAAHEAVRLITTDIAKENGFDSWDQVPAGSAKKTLAVLESQLREVYEKEFKQGVAEALAKNPNDVGAALKVGEDKLYDSIGPYIDLPDSPVSDGTELTPDAQKFIDGIDSAFRKNLLIDKFIAAHPEFQIAKAAAVGERLGLVKQEFAQTFKELGLDESRMQDQALTAIYQKFHHEVQGTLEEQANEYFDSKVTFAIKGDATINEVAIAGRIQFLGDLDNADSQLRKMIHQEAKEALKDITLDEGRAAMVKASMDQIEITTAQAIDKLGLTDEVSAKAYHTIQDSVQRRAEGLAKKVLDKTIADSADKGDIIGLTNTAQAHFRQELAMGVLSEGALKDALAGFTRDQQQSIVDAHIADAEQGAKAAVAAALKNREASQVVISQQTYQKVRESAISMMHSKASLTIGDKLSAVNLADADPNHLKQVVHQAAAEGKKQFEAELAIVDPKIGLKPLQANAEWFLKEHVAADQQIRDKIAKAIAAVPQDHLTEYEVKSGQTVSHILVEAKQALTYSSYDARKLAAFIAINESELADMHYAFEKTGALAKDGFFPVTLDNLYDSMIKAENGDPEARKRLMEAVWWIQKGHTLKTLNLADHEKIINILKLNRAQVFVKV